MSERQFRVLRGQSRVPREERDLWPATLPWSLVEPWRAQAERNHSQTLEVLDSRGGLAPEELWAAAHGLGLRDMLRKTTAIAAGAWLRGLARSEPPWGELDAGIRETVRALWLAGFEPTDSGDGSKADMECAIADVAHVFMRCAPADLARRADELAILVSDWPSSGNYNGNRVEASYSPSDGIAVLMLFGCTAPMPEAR